VATTFKKKRILSFALCPNFVVQASWQKRWLQQQTTSSNNIRRQKKHTLAMSQTIISLANSNY